MMSTCSATARTSSQVPKPRVDLRVVDRIEAGVDSINRIEERQQMNPAEESAERAFEHSLKIAKSAA